MLIGFTAIILFNSYMLPSIYGPLYISDIDKPTIALTFDDGPLPATTLPLLDFLKENDVKATFFILGRMAKQYPEIVKRIADEGHQIGNHTEDHKSLYILNGAGIKHQIETCQATIKLACGYQPTAFRPPYEDTNKQLEQLIKSKYGLTSFLWNIDPKDWKIKNQEMITNKVIANAKPNGIVILHDIYPTTVQAVPEIIKVLKQAGYRFVTCDEIIK